jgi:hypothetical protein
MTTSLWMVGTLRFAHPTKLSDPHGEEARKRRLEP